MKNLLSLFVLFGMVFSPAFAQGDSSGCNPGAQECINESSYHICTGQGIWGEPQYCGQGLLCVDGGCINPRGIGPQLGCNPGTRECIDSTSYHVCTSYAVWGEPQYCGQGQTCSDGQCVPAPQCNYHDTRCSPTDGHEVQICNSQGQWQDYRHCSYGCRDGACMDCRPGDTRCYDDTHYQACDSDGEWGNKKSCGSGYVCDSGDCVQGAYGPCFRAGETRCAPNSQMELQKCSNGYWKDYIYCPMGCANDMCVQCFTGNTQCVDSTHYQACGSLGQWGASVACPAGQVCSVNKCQAPAGDQCATPGIKRCSPSNPKMVQSCNENNVYVDYLQCDLGCINGQCAECEPGATVCAGVSSYRTCSAGGQLSDPVECGSGYTCDNGVCEATPVCTDGQRNCVSDTIYSCVGGEWQLLFHCPSNNDCVESEGTAYCQPEQPAKPSEPSQPAASGGLTGLEMLLGAGVVLLGGALVYFLFFRK